MSVTISGSGQIIKQVVSVTSTTLFSSSSTTPVDIGLSASITPSNSANKIFVIFSFSASATNALSFYLNRNGTNIDLGSGGSTRNATIASVPTGAAGYLYSYATHYLDSPASTSAVTYKIQADTDTGTFYVNRRNDTSFASPMTITLMEVAYA